MKKQYFLRIVFYLWGIFLVGKIVEYVSYDNYTSARTTIHDFYEESENIDILFLGSSHTYASFNPQYLDVALNKNTFNLGTGDQQLDGSLLLLKEANKNNNIQEVYLDLYFRIAFDSPYKERTGSELGYCYTVSDNVKWSIDKVKYLVNISSSDDYILNFIPARRRWYKLFDYQYIQDNIKTKLSKEYRNYVAPDNLFGNGKYIEKGYIELESQSDLFIQDYHTFNFESINDISADWKKSLLEIIEYCNDNNIKLTLVTTPMPEFLLADTQIYDDYTLMVSEIAEQYNLDYYDFNLCKTDILKLDREDYCDETHLSYKGVEKFQKVFVNLINGKIDKNIFYNSYQEKLLNEPKQIFGLIVDRKNDYRIIPITNAKESEITYAITFVDNAGNEQLIQENSNDNQILKSINVSGKYYISCFINGISNGVYELENDGEI